MHMSLKSLLARAALSSEALGAALLPAYHRAVGPYWRRQAVRRREALCATYVAVTGSCGKSTTTMLTAALLAGQGTAASGMLRNTERQVWRALRKLAGPVDAFVQEVSEFPRGTLARAAAALRPDVAVVTSVDLDHLDAFRTRAAVADEMGTLTAAIGPGGAVCLNADDAGARGLAGGAGARIVRFGRAADADVRAENVTAELPGRLGFDLVIGDRRRRVQTRFAGTLMLTNVLAALAVVHALGRDLDRAVADLATIEPLRRRMSIIEVPGGHTLLLDTVKAPVWSAQRLVDDLPNIWRGRRLFVLGELSDKGNNGGAKYRRVLRAAAARADLAIGVLHAESAARRLQQAEPDLPIAPAAGLAALEALLRDQPPSLVVFKGNSFDIDAMIERLVAARAGAAA